MKMAQFDWLVLGRRRFLSLAAVSAISTPSPAQTKDDRLNVFGPLPGYSPQIGTLVSEMTWMRSDVLNTVHGLNKDQLDFLLDKKANRIGALLLHLAATERLYQLNTFDNVPIQELGTNLAFKEWGVATELGEPARQAIKGHELSYYLDRLHETRERTLTEFRKRDDMWLMAVDKSWVWGPTNNLCKWFHVTEHESHHSGQIAMLRGRADGDHTAING
jgi:uncharacterized damage-inducible protein DinB